MSRLAAETGSGVASSGVGDSSLPRQAEITVDHRADGELLNIIKESKEKGILVLIVPSSDRPLATAGLEILVQDGESGKKVQILAKTEKKKKGQKDFLAWLFLLSSLAASITYTAGLSPPGGVWGADDKANGYVAGSPVLRDKALGRYLAFYYANATAFFASLTLIGMLNKPITSRTQKSAFSAVVSLGLLSLAISYVAGTCTTSIRSALYTITLAMSFLLYMFVYHGLPTIVFLCGKQ